jgi:hypothetical protein
MSAPTAFGFLDRAVAPISIEGKGELPQYESPETGLNLSLPQTELKTVSLVGGDIKMEKGTFYLGQYLDTFGNLATGPILIPLISSHSGNINLVSVKSPGEVVFTEDGLNLSGFNTMGTIDITDKVAIDVSGYYGGGNIRIFSDYLNIEESSIHSRSWGFIDGRSVDIRVNHFNFSNGSVMNCDVEGSGNGSDIHIHAESISLVGTETPFSPSYFKLWNASVPTEGEPGNVGSIIMNADTIHFDIAIIQSTVSGRGNAAMINLNARDSIVLKNSWISSVSRAQGNASHVNLNAANNMILNTTSIEMPTENTGSAGDLFVEATNISLLNGSTIILKTRGDGKGGMATLKAQNSVTLEGESIAGFPNSIQLETGQYSGNAGNLLIEANDQTFPRSFRNHQLVLI